MIQRLFCRIGRACRAVAIRACAGAIALAVAGTGLQPVAAAAPAPTAIDPVASTSGLMRRADKTFSRESIAPERFIRPSAGARAFVAFPVVDANRNPVSPDTPIKTPTGGTMKAGDYWAQVNAIEQKLNAKGESIRDLKIDDGRLLGSTQPELLAKVNYKPRGAARLKIGTNNLAALLLLGHKRIVFIEKSPPASGHPPLTAPSAAPTPKPSPTPFHKPGTLGPSAPPSFGPVNLNGTGNGTHTPLPTPKGASGPPAGYGSSGGGGSGAPATANPTVCQYASNQTQAIAAANLLSLGLKAADCPPITGSVPGPVSGYATTIDLPWAPTPWGDKSLAQFYVNANLALTADPSQGNSITTTSNAAVGAYILSAGGDIFSAMTQVTGTTASVTLSLFGKSVYSTSAQSVLSYNFDDPQTFFNVQVDIPILFFDLILSASAGGDFGINFNFNLSNGSAAFSITPFLNLFGSFSASIGIDIVVASVSVGVYGNLTIANITLPASATAGFGLTNTLQGPSSATASYSNTGALVTGSSSNQIIGCQLTFTHKLTLDFKYQLLAGTAGVQAQACFLFYCDTAQHQLYGWQGITGDDNILDDEGNAANVGPMYTDLPQYGFALGPSQAYSPDDQNEEPTVCDQFALLAQ